MPARVRQAALAGVLLALLPAAALLALLPAAPASAHANLVRSEPAANEPLALPPREVRAWFSEPMAPDFSELTVLDERGERVDLGDSAVLPDGTGMRVSLPPLDPGVYTVAWRNLSTVDGHTLRGAFTFFVGVEPTAVEPVTNEPPLLQSPFEPVVRWVVLLGAMTFAGTLLVRRFVLEPALAPLAGAGPARERLMRVSLRLALAALGALLLGSAAHAWVQAGVLSDGGALAALGEPLRGVLTGTDWGRAWAWRMAAAAAAGVALGVAVRREDGGGGLRGVNRHAHTAAAVLAAGALVAISAASHAAAAQDVRTPALAADVLHLLAASAWAGGLPLLLAASVIVRRSLPAAEARAALGALVPRFSLLAAASVLVLTVTGVYSGWVQVGGPGALDTPYGRSLVAKVGLVLAVLALGAVNLLVIRRRLASSERAARWLPRLVAGEVALVAAVVLLTGLLTSLEPARQADARQEAAAGIAFEGGDEATRIEARIEPGRSGLNRVTVEVRDRGGAPVTDAERVAVRLRYLDQDLGATDLTAEHEDGGRYTTEETLLSLAGGWQAEVEVGRPGAFDARAVSRFELGAPGATPALAPPPRTAWQFAVGALVVLGAGFVGIALLAQRDRRLPDAPPLAAGVTAIVLAFLLIARIPSGQAALAGNPIPPDDESIERGRALYAEQCATCHGPTARGDGPQADELSTRPADLVVHVPLHADSELFGLVSRGIEGTAMPAFGETLSDEEIWHLLNYLRTLEEEPAER